MGYSHGKVWDDEEIETAIKKIIEIVGIDSMPTHKQMNEITGNTSLANAVMRHGGTKHWANKLGLGVKSCESEIGYEYECLCMDFLSSLGYNCELTKIRYPYDIIVNHNIKIDVKVSHLYKGKNGNFYAFNLGKSMPTCDIFICYCVNNSEIVKIYVIPSCILSGNTQLSVGVNHSNYDDYVNNWDIIHKFDNFYLQLINKLL